MKLPGFVGPTYVAKSVVADAQECINLYAERVESQRGKTDLYLLLAPGFTSFSTAVVATKGRALFHEDGRCFAVIGGGYYEIFSDGTATKRGDVAIDAFPATISSSGDAGGQNFITSGNVGYIHDLETNAFTQVLDSVRMGGYVDGYFVGLDVAISRMQISGLLDGLTWNALDFAERTAAGDKWTSMVISHGEVWLLGSQTSEIWINTGASAFPFEPIAGTAIEQGVLGSFAAAKFDNSVVWAGASKDGDRMIWRAQQYTPIRISTHAMEAALKTYPTVSDAVAWTYQEDGHTTFVLSFEAAKVSWVYDAANGLWHKRGYWNREEARYEAYRAQFHCHAFGKHLVCDRTSGTIYRLSNDLYTDIDGQGIKWIRRAPHVGVENASIAYPRLELLVQAGVGLPAGQGSDPEVMLRYSDDFGQTWSNERKTKIGKQGKYKNRAIFTRLGSSRGGRVFEVSGSDPIPWRLIDAFIDVAPGTA